MAVYHGALISGGRALLTALVLLLCVNQWALGEHLHLDSSVHLSDCSACQLSTGKAAPAVETEIRFVPARYVVAPPPAAPPGAAAQLSLPAVRGPPPPPS